MFKKYSKRKKLVLFGVALTVLFMAILVAVEIGKSTSVNTSFYNQEKDTKLAAPEYRLGVLEEISGSRNYYMKLVEVHSKLSRSRGGGVRNLLFFRNESLSQAWLFPEHDNQILSVRQIEEQIDDQRVATIAILYEYVSEDSNNDGLLNHQDVSTIAISKPDGQRIVVLADNVNAILGKVVQEDLGLITLVVHMKNHCCPVNLSQ